VVCPVDPAELGDGVADAQASLLGGAASDDAVDLCKGRLEGCGRGLEACRRVVCCLRVALRLLGHAGVVRVEALLDERHDLLVVVLQPDDARARRAYYSAGQR
jgi:hypothetical protein